MFRFLATCVLSVAALSATGVAGDHFYFPGHVFAGRQVVYAAPVVSYRPAYFVPVTTVGVASYGMASFPVSTISYSTQYYAPMVPTMPIVAAPQIVPVGYYGPQIPILSPAIYSAPVSYGYHGRRHHGRRFRGVEIEIERDGDIEIDYR